MKTSRKTGYVIVVILAIIALIANTGDRASMPDLIKDMAPEEKLAILDAGGNIGKDDKKVKRIKVLLNILSDRFHEPVDKIADITCRGQGALQDKGIYTTNQVILEEVNEMGKLPNTRYFDAVALYGAVQLK